MSCILTLTWYEWHMYFLRKNHIKHMHIYSGLDRDVPIMCAIPKMHFVLSRKFSGWELSSHGMDRDGKILQALLFQDFYFKTFIVKT